MISWECDLCGQTTTSEVYLNKLHIEKDIKVDIPSYLYSIITPEGWDLRLLNENPVIYCQICKG